MPILISQLQLHNFLSFGAASPIIDLGPLNIIIGTNGSGKSNLGMAVELLRRIPLGFGKAVERTGDPRDLVFRGAQDGKATIRAVFENPDGRNVLYSMSFILENARLRLAQELVQRLAVSPYSEPADDPTRFAYVNNGSTAVLRPPSSALEIAMAEMAGPVTPGDTVLVQVRAPGAFPEIGFLQETLGRIRLYRKLSHGPDSPLREPARADEPADYLSERMDNLPLVLGSFVLNVPLKRRVVELIGTICQDFDDYAIIAQNNQVSLHVQQHEWSFAASRLSDGTLKMLALVAVLLHPTPPPLVFIDEPELGLHPDMIPTLADLLRDAATRTQLIVTTHSRDLIDCFTTTPEVVLVCEKVNGQTYIEQANAPGFKKILERKSLGRMWSEGHIGGNRW